MLVAQIVTVMPPATSLATMTIATNYQPATSLATVTVATNYQLAMIIGFGDS